MGQALDWWIQTQREFGTPDSLQGHLAAIFPRHFGKGARRA